jgi:hypothetical protein
MSTRSVGMVGKTYKTTEEAFKEPSYYVAIERPQQNEYSVFWGLMGALAFVAVFGYCFYLTISRF